MRISANISPTSVHLASLAIASPKQGAGGKNPPEDGIDGPSVSPQPPNVIDFRYGKLRFISCKAVARPGTAPFFVLRRGGPVRRPLVEWRFKGLRQYANVNRFDGSLYQPRLHDLRHSFAVHRLVSWYPQGADVQKLLPQLSHLGHLRISDTQPYLTMTTELLHEASARFERYAWKEKGND